MRIPTYVLALKDHNGNLRLAEGKRSDFDLPVSFDEQYAEFLFQFGESRIRCKENDEILLLKGDLDISDIEQDHQFVESFKRRIREIEDFTGWQPLKSKTAMSEHSPSYRQRVSRHLMAKRDLFNNQHKNDSDVA